MREATEIRSASRDTRVNFHGGNWNDFCGMLGYDPLEEINKYGSFVPVDYSLAHSTNVRLEYMERWDSAYNDDLLVVRPRYRHRITYVWWW